ncbi:S41 family peptidase [Neolewinella persica]|uniref:S41 family peptidase n=1 Tax=Neolewinella persica TaxID=70998 RepID=UPI0003A2EA7B|nr:S41 family peptidase [Neolewinella persica]
MQQRWYPTLLILLLLCTCVRAQTDDGFDYFPPMRPPAGQLDFLTKEGDPKFPKANLVQFAKEFSDSERLTERTPTQLRIGNNRLSSDTIIVKLHQENASGSEWLTLFNFGVGVNDPQNEMWKMIGTYSGVQYNNSCFYLKLGGEELSTLQATAIIGTLVISTGIEFPFSLPAWGEFPDAAQQAAYLNAVEVLSERVDKLVSHLVPKDRMIYATHPDRPLTAAERTFGLVQFWTEAKYNFAYFDQVPELNWDAALQEYLPLVQAAEDDASYYRLLEQFCALLKDGHTNIYPPAHVAQQFDRPQLKIELVDGAPVVVNRSEGLSYMIPLGARITSVNNQPVAAYLEEHIYPYISIGSDHVRQRWGAHDVLKGPAGSNVGFSYQKVEGMGGSATLPRNRNSSDITWEVPDPDWFLTKFEMLEGDVGRLTLNSFGNSRAAEEFLEYLPEIRKCRKLIIDLRENGGGNSGVGYDMLKYFTDKPLLTSSWQTREHRAANRAWGKFVAKDDPTTLSEWDRNNQKMYFGEVWHIAPADTIQPADDPMPDMPVAVLVSNYTASAAEDFLVAADVLENFTFIGEPSFGSTGQPLMLSLPGGGSARICTKRDTYPDGKVFVGPGVSVDIHVTPSIRDYLDGRDVVLAKALEVLK